jgi:hypothetical protein
MMRNMLLVGGLNSDNASQKRAWAAYAGGRIIKLHPSGTMKSALEDRAIPDYLNNAEDVGTVFKAASISKSDIIICTTTEVRKYRLLDFKLIQSVTHPKFNDLHHAIELDDCLLVVSTGLDGLIKITWEGEVKEYWSLDVDKESMFSDDVDYRQVASTKPHTHHPNFVFMIGENIYVTRFKDGDAVCVNNANEKAFLMPQGNPHDGVKDNKSVWFTTTNGWLYQFDQGSRALVDSIDLNGLLGDSRPLGWCRGLAVLPEDKVMVGFSRLRETKFKENIRWLADIAHFKKAPLPTRIAEIDIKSRVCNSEFNIEDDVGLNAVFSIISCDDRKS